MAARKNLRRRALSLPSGRAMQMETFVGLDVHRKSVVATAIDGTGQLVAQKKLGPNDSELTEFLESLPGRKHVALEACAMWEHIVVPDPDQAPQYWHCVRAVTGGYSCRSSTPVGRLSLTGFTRISAIASSTTPNARSTSAAS